MSEAIAFVDTLKFAKRLVDAGIDPKHAEAITEGIAEQHLEFLNSNLATKVALAQVEASLKIDIANLETDLARVEASLKTDIAQVEANLKTGLANLKTDLARVEANLKTDLAQVEANLKIDLANLKTGIANTETSIANTETRLIKWMVGIMLSGMFSMTALFFGLVKFAL